MRTVVRDVRFYQTVFVLDDPEATQAIRNAPSDFWSKTFTKLDDFDAASRRASVGNREYYGKAVRPKRPAIDHLQVGRLRDPSEHIEETDLLSGEVEPLTLPDHKRVSEPTFLVPVFGTSVVAVTSPGQSTRAGTIANWLTTVLDLVPKGRSLRLTPIIDELALERLAETPGAVGFDFQFEATEELPQGTDVALMDAVDRLRKAGPESGTVQVAWSLGYDGGSTKSKNQLKEFARTVVKSAVGKRLKVNMLVEQDDGKFKREVHSIFEDQLISKASWKVQAGVRLTTEQILDSMMKAIASKREELRVSGSN